MRGIFLVLIAGCSLPAPDLERSFRNDPLWRGADACFSVPLGPDRALWLFGDTWIGPRRAGAKMIRNSAAILSGGRFAFHWREGPDDAFKPARGDGWLWPLHGARLGPTLYLFFSQLIATKSGLGFAASNNLLMVVGNPDAPIAEWRTRLVEIPFFRRTENGDTAFGAACVADGELCIFGIREDWKRGMGGRSVVVARTATPEDFASWKISEPLFDEGATEFSVGRFGSGFVAVYTRFGLSDEIHARFAPKPEGPWSAPKLIYRVPDVAWSKNYFSYAAKAHPELATAPGELVVTYATNSWELADHVRDAERLYWPRVVRLTLRHP